MDSLHHTDARVGGSDNAVQLLNVGDLACAGRFVRFGKVDEGAVDEPRLLVMQRDDADVSRYQIPPAFRK